MKRAAREGNVLDPKGEMMKKKWESYEEVAAYLLNKFASEFGIGLCRR